MKKLISILLAMVMLTILAACGGSSSGQSSAAPPASSGAAQSSAAPAPASGASGTVKFFYWGEEQKSGMEKIVELFKVKNPNITVELTLIPGRDNYYTSLQTSLPVGTGPDIMWHNSNIADYLDYMYPLNELVAASDIDLSKYPKSIVDFYTYDGTLYAIPKDFDTIAIFYNKEIFDNMGVPYPTAGWKWEDFLKTAQDLTTADHFGFAMDVNDHQVGFGNFGRQQRGAATHAVRSDPVLVNDAPMVEAMQFIMDLMYTHKVAVPASEITEMPASDQFMAEKAAMVSNGSWKVGPYYDVLGDKLGVVELPAGKYQGCQINGLGYAISKDTKNFDAAWEFLQFLASQEGQAATSRVVIPAYSGAADEWLAAYPSLDLQVFLDATSYAYVEYPYMKDSRKVNQMLVDHISAISADPGHDIQAELNAAQAEMEEALK